MELKEELTKALEELRKNKVRKFDQTVDLIINLQKYSLKKDSTNILVAIPHKIRDKKIGAFLESKNKEVDTITLSEFKNYSEKSELKKLVKKYDFFIAQSSLMPKVATTFGRALGPSGKMPSPQLGILINVDERGIKELIKKVNSSVRVKVKESSIKLSVGKQSMRDEEITENILAVYNAVLKALPREKENIKNLEIKFTMTKPIKIKVR